MSIAYDSDLENIQNRPKRLSIDELRQYPGLEHLSEKDATDALETIYGLAGILFEIHCANQAICIDSQLVVNLKEQKQAA